MRRYYLLVALGAVAATLLVAGGVAGAPPVFFLDSDPDAADPSFLPSAGCPFDPPPGGSQIVARVHGWESPILVPQLGTRDVSLHAEVQGTVVDRAGNVYGLHGSFHQSGVTRFPAFEVAFDGSGELTLAGRAGVVSGEAVFRVVASGPPEWQFYFTRIRVCSVS